MCRPPTKRDSNVFEKDDDEDMPSVSRSRTTTAWHGRLSVEHASLLLLVVSAGSYSIMGCFVKLITTTTHLSSVELVFFRAVFQITIVVTAMFFFTTPVPKTRIVTIAESDRSPGDPEIEQQQQQQQQHETYYVEEPLIRHPFGLTKDIVRLVAIRGMCGGCGFCLYFYTISVLPLGDAVTILSLNPVMCVLIASVVLQEPLTKAHVFSAVSSVVGSVFLARPSFLFGTIDDSTTHEDGEGESDDTLSSSSSRQWGYFSGFLGACTGACVYILIRKAGKKGVHTLNLLFSWCVFGLLFSTVVVLVGGTFAWPSSTKTWAYILISCVFGTFAHFILNFAARLAPAGVASIIRSSGIVWSYLLEILVFHEVPQAWTVLGVGLILTSLGVIAFEKHQESRQYQHQDHQSIATNDASDREGHSTRNRTTLQLPTLPSKDNGIGLHSRKASESSYGSIDDEVEELIPSEKS